MSDALEKITEDLFRGLRLPLHIAMRPETLAEAWHSCRAWMWLYSLLRFTYGENDGRYVSAGNIALAAGKRWEQPDRSMRGADWDNYMRDASEGIRAAVPCPTFEDVMAAIARKRAAISFGRGVSTPGGNA